MTKPDHAETMRIQSKILQVQDKRMNEVEGRLNSLACEGEEKNNLFEQLHHASGKHILDMSEQLSGMQMAHDASGGRGSSVQSKVRDLTQAVEISREIQTCQERLGDVSAASRIAQRGRGSAPQCELGTGRHKRADSGGRPERDRNQENGGRLVAGRGLAEPQGGAHGDEAEQHAETYNLLQWDMLSGNRSKKTRS